MRHRRRDLRLNVRTLAQKVLWEQELTGQLSDGHWENARPDDHWIEWSDATVAVRPDALGRNWEPRRRRYNFADWPLLDVVHTRMLAYVRLAMFYGEEQGKQYADLLDLDGRLFDLDRGWDGTRYEGTYWDEMRTKFLFVDRREINNVLSGYYRNAEYGLSELIKDLRDLNRIITIRMPEEAAA